MDRTAQEIIKLCRNLSIRLDVKDCKDILDELTMIISYEEAERLHEYFSSYTNNYNKPKHCRIYDVNIYVISKTERRKNIIDDLI